MGSQRDGKLDFWAAWLTYSMLPNFYYTTTPFWYLKGVMGEGEFDFHPSIYFSYLGLSLQGRRRLLQVNKLFKLTNVNS